MRFLFYVLLTVFSTTASSMVLISDLDDTLKITNVQNPLETIENAFLNQQAFFPMPELISSMQEYASETYILTASPHFISSWVTDFLSHNHIFYNSLFTRQTLNLKSKAYYKIKKIREIIHHTDSRLILVGDNVSNDEEIYLTIQHLYPSRVEAIYIHKVIDKKLKSKTSIPYITAFEIAEHEYQQGRLSKEKLFHIGESLFDEQTDFSLVIPRFAFCPTNNTHMTSISQDRQVVQLRSQLKQKIIRYCNRRLLVKKARARSL